MKATSSSHAASEFDIGIDGGHDSEQSTSLATATVYGFCGRLLNCAFGSS